MRAVNLMPGDSPAGGRFSNRDSGVGAYVLLVALAALVVCAAVWATANKQAGDRQVTLERVTVQAAAANKRADAGQPYVQFQQLAQDRVRTVTALSTTRFDWAHAMREVGRVLPADVWLTGLSGASGADAAAPTPSTSVAPAPTITLEGCTRSQSKVARLMARLRSIDGVRAVALKTSEKPDATGDVACPANRATDPRFSLALSFAVPGAPRDRVDATGQIAATQRAPAAATPAATQAAAVASVATNKEG